MDWIGLATLGLSVVGGIWSVYLYHNANENKRADAERQALDARHNAVVVQLASLTSAVTDIRLQMTAINTGLGRMAQDIEELSRESSGLDAVIRNIEHRLTTLEAKSG